MEVWLVIGLLVLGLYYIIFGLMKWNEMRYSRKKGLPPGTMGWPLFGETLRFVKHGPDFMRAQGSRYGSVFKTHILGCPTVISMDQELNRFIFMNEAKGIIPGYPKSNLDIQGTSNIAAVQGLTHKRIQGSLLSLIGLPTVRQQLSPKVDKYMRNFLHGWDGQIIDMQDKSNDMTFDIVFRLLFENEPTSVYDVLKPEFRKLFLGTLSLPIYFPGSHYYQGLQARKRIIEVLKQIIENRRESSAERKDMFHDLLRQMEDSRFEMKMEDIMDQVITILHAGNETMAKTAMMLTKYLHENPKALQELREEHLRIRERKNPEDPIDWNDYKSMPFTRAVIWETSRLATIVNGVLRKTTKEMELNGYVIPKGWRIYVYTRGINFDPFIYPEPSSFNPWRWMEKNLESHNYNFLFGGGTRLCPGKEFGIFMLSIFLHYFVTGYRWEEVGKAKINIFPRVVAPQGLHMRVMKY